MEWVCAADELPPNDGAYFIIDLRYNRKRIAHYNSNRGRQSLFYRIPDKVLWGKESTPEHNARILKESQQAAKNTGGVYVHYSWQLNK
jgi:hypothetical protein